MLLLVFILEKGTRKAVDESKYRLGTVSRYWIRTHASVSTCSLRSTVLVNSNLYIRVVGALNGIDSAVTNS